MLITNIITMLLIVQARQVIAGQDTVQGKTRQYKAAKQEVR